MQFNFSIHGLIPKHANIKSRVWLEKDKILLQKKETNTYVSILIQESKNGMAFAPNEEIILPFLRILSLLTNHAITLQSHGGISLNSKEEFGKKVQHFQIREIEHWSEKELKDMETKIAVLIKHMKSLHKKYIDIINENEHLKTALNLLYESNTKHPFSNEGFVQIVTGIESLYGDSNGDITYRLSCRSAFLLGLVPEQSEKPCTIFNNIKKIYGQRSGLVHDGIIKKSPLMRKEAFDYLRHSLIVMIILHKNAKIRSASKDKRKSNILSKIDCAIAF